MNDTQRRAGDRYRPETQDRLAFAALADDQVCAICHQNPCQGHPQPQFVSGLAAAGLLFASPARRAEEWTDAENQHLRPVA